MSCIDLHSILEPQTLVSCQNCSWTGLASHLHAIRDLASRIAPGETVPAGQCPDCGALAHLHAQQSSVCVEVFALASDTRDGTAVFAGTRKARGDLLRERFLGEMLKASVPSGEPVVLPDNPTPAQIEDTFLQCIENGYAGGLDTFALEVFTIELDEPISRLVHFARSFLETFPELASDEPLNGATAVDRIAALMPSASAALGAAEDAGFVIDERPVLDGPTDTEGQPCRHVNHYECVCGENWTDQWSCQCDDECPVCGRKISPHSSDYIED
jgi:hypothetical protein